MLLIHCPYCGPRAQIEFRNDGELRPRPDDPMLLNEADWTDYLYNRTNHKGSVNELWWHQHGCRQWFEVSRDTVSNAFIYADKPGAAE